MLRPLLQWNLAVVPADAFRFQLASRAVLTRVDGLFREVTRLCLLPPRSRNDDLSSVCAGVNILLRIVAHVLPAADVCPDFSLLARLVVGRLDVGVLTGLFQIAVVFLAFVSRIRYDVLVSFSCVPLHLQNEWNERRRIVGCAPSLTQTTYCASTPNLMLYAGLSFPFFMASSFIRMKVAS